MDRLDKFIATHSEATRSLAKMAIKAGRVLVNGEVVRDQGKKVSEQDEVEVNGVVITKSGDVYLALYKPVDVVCATKDEEFETVIDLVDGFTHKDLHIAGRLDKDTTGLVLLTSDGQWSHRVTSPKHACEKVYRFETADPIDEDYVEQFAKGIMLRGEDKATLPAKLKILGEREGLLTLTEGKYHQVKRMFGAMGNKVESLHRESVGGIGLRDLEPGEFYELSEDEISRF
ncbi:ribosomal small subunit pseudouridine synthase A [Rubritalea squalenifaciens DSM 18772]|uniref:Pseudouridine synthase n=2 Tax=Rubritalea TaxID=361050 RepID=A0A1M6L475_9BACT|nr:pseudouridine synthase [Rubritalea squalenifaciens]SHJ66021.1 ribosomal small subunit pseudouridine synthase A [Rubritalea squalenifaciens DSM 18772]